MKKQFGYSTEGPTEEELLISQPQRGRTDQRRLLEEAKLNTGPKEGSDMPGAGRTGQALTWRNIKPRTA